MRCSRGHGVSRAAGLQCQYVRGMPWSSSLTGGTSVSGALSVGMDQGVWCRWTVRVACLCLLGAASRMVAGIQPSPDGLGSSRFVSPSFGAYCTLWRGWGCWCWKGLYAASISLGPWVCRKNDCNIFACSACSLHTWKNDLLIEFYARGLGQSRPRIIETEAWRIQYQCKADATCGSRANPCARPRA